MFSTTTIASSTTKPVATVSAMSERLSKLKCKRYIAPKVLMIDTGTTILGIMVDRTLRKKRNTTKITSRPEITTVRWASFMEARMVGDRSMTTERLMAGEIAARSCGNKLRTASTVLITFT